MKTALSKEASRDRDPNIHGSNEPHLELPTWSVDLIGAIRKHPDAAFRDALQISAHEVPDKRHLSQRLDCVWRARPTLVLGELVGIRP